MERALEPFLRTNPVYHILYVKEAGAGGGVSGNKSDLAEEGVEPVGVEAESETLRLDAGGTVRGN